MSSPQSPKLNKIVQHMLNGGDIATAKVIAREAHAAQRDHFDGTPIPEEAQYAGRVRHRIGQIIAQVDGPTAAAKHFDLAESLFDDRNIIGRAMVLRDEGWAYRVQIPESPEVVRTALEHIESALNLFPDIVETGSRMEVEREVTRGMWHRLAGDPSAIDELVRLDGLLRSSSHAKLIYRLDNLRALVRLQSGTDHIRTCFEMKLVQAKIAALNEAWYAHQALRSWDFIRLGTGPLVRRLP